jgi:uncharacterized damage-inducible protein DinB
MADALLRHFRLMARYNRLANERLFAACARLPETELTRARPAFFKSILGTLNHILVGDRIWLARFEGRDMPSTGLDAILYREFGALRAARAAEDARIEAFAAGLDENFLTREFVYINNEGRKFADAAPMLLAHFFNHQTHHRGQAHDLLTETGIPTPVLDLHRVIKPDPERDLSPKR